MTDHHGRLPKVSLSHRGILQAHILQRVSLLFVIICTYCPRLKSMALHQTGSTVRYGDPLPIIEMLQLSRRKYMKCISGFSCIQNEELISYLSDHLVPPYSVPVSDKPKTGNPTKPCPGMPSDHRFSIPSLQAASPTAVDPLFCLCSVPSLYVSFSSSPVLLPVRLLLFPPLSSLRSQPPALPPSHPSG